LGVVVVGVAATVVSPTPAAAACALPGNGILGGTAQGEDYRYARIQVSIDLFDSAGTRIGWDGCPQTGGYSRVVNINTHLGGTGTNDPVGQTKDWVLTGIPANAVRANVEAYPKSPTGTDLTRYGRSFRHNRMVGDTGIHLKLPVNCGYADNSVFGRNGSIVGHVTQNGRLVRTERISAWSHADPARVQPMGFGIAARIPDGVFSIDYLAANQPYVLFVRFTPDTPLRYIWDVWVDSCSATEVDIVFGKFQDVPYRHAFFEEIGWMLQAGLTDGYPGDVFRPGTAVSRQAMAAWLHRLDGAPAGPFGAGGLTDVAGGAFANEIGWMVHVGAAAGFADRTFRPNQCMTRQALVAMLHRRAGAPSAPTGLSVTDVSAGHPFRTAISWALATGTANGYPDGTFRPGECVSRQAAAAFLYRAAAST